MSPTATSTTTSTTLRKIPECDQSEKLITFHKSMTAANEALRHLIQSRDGEMSRLEEAEADSKLVEEDCSQVNDFVIDLDKYLNNLHISHNQELQKHNEAMAEIRAEIINLKREIEQQVARNSRLHQDLKDHTERWQQLQYRPDSFSTYANDIKPIVSNQSSILERLRQET